MKTKSLLLAVVLGALASCSPKPDQPGSTNDELIAIDVLIIPDQKMMAESEKWNTLMREQTPEGFELDEEHAPHVTLIQRFVSKSDIPKILDAVEGVKAKFDVTQFEMVSTGLYHIPIDTTGLAGIVIEPSEELLSLQEAVIAAVNPYAKEGGGESAFVPDKSGTPFDPLLFKYIETFVPHQAGEKFNPHVTIGIAPITWLEDLEKKPFEQFTSSGVGIATYQLGNFGTASKRLDQ